MKSISVLFIALVTLTACLAQPIIVVPMEDVGYSWALLEQVNMYRLENGLNPLRLDPVLVRLAKNHSFEMFKKRRANHRNFDDRFAQAMSNLCVENVGWNYSSPRDLFDGWRQSRGHNRNMLKEGINRAGIAEIGKYVTFFACK